MALRSRGDPLTLAVPVRDALAELDPNLPVTDVDTMERALKRLASFFVVMGWFFAAFGGVALLMAAVGLYGVIAFTVGRRTREMGIRMALGAHRDDVVRFVLAKGMKQMGLGMAIGLLLGAGLARPLRLVAFRVDPDDPSVYAAIVGVLLLAGFLACLVPALRASRVEIVRAVTADG